MLAPDLSAAESCLLLIYLNRVKLSLPQKLRYFGRGKVSSIDCTLFASVRVPPNKSPTAFVSCQSPNSCPVFQPFASEIIHRPRASSSRFELYRDSLSGAQGMLSAPMLTIQQIYINAEPSMACALTPGNRQLHWFFKTVFENPDEP